MAGQRQSFPRDLKTSLVILVRRRDGSPCILARAASESRPAEWNDVLESLVDDKEVIVHQSEISAVTNRRLPWKPSRMASYTQKATDTWERDEAYGERYARAYWTLAHSVGNRPFFYAGGVARRPCLAVLAIGVNAIAVLIAPMRRAVTAGGWRGPLPAKPVGAICHADSSRRYCPRCNNVTHHLHLLCRQFIPDDGTRGCTRCL